jgi:hypothetical protein|tara:strand:+ start:3696 stop:3917 length:222 start_codon:yes stop_codon:yes gene_type:complete
VTRVQVYGEYIFFFKEEDIMSQEIETRLKAIETRLEAIESLVGMTSLDDLMEESKTLLDAGTPLKVFNTEVSS